ncbi:hypothetical protein SAMN04488523_102235 [Sulfitobacter brevis]|uniref:Uncharacterized protein n=1 Tax=Sulfitobacter brevis TaxID=74348 RepID=A0A1I1UTI9_9RHOB|nr:hypothetical protein [Sulfitobacter brevis]SFD73905.1 hypothetical protein SAMN04488523_102235 [Sulfitobacter brevis]
MKRFLSITAAVVLTATSSFAQTTSQAAVLEGNSGNPAYPLVVQGANGVIYSCEAAIVAVDGVNARRCVKADASLYTAGSGLATGAAIGAGLIGIILIASNGSNSTTTTTTGS